MNYAALDIGTNNCRLLIAQGNQDGKLVILDSYADSVFLGEELYESGVLSVASIKRCLAVLSICASKIQEHPTISYRAIATEACRIAKNGEDFIQQVKQTTGLDIDIISRKEESRLACISCKPLIRNNTDYCLIFEIGGGSIQLSWVDAAHEKLTLLGHVSLPIGILIATSRWGEGAINDDLYQSIFNECLPYLEKFDQTHQVSEHIKSHNVQMISASGTPVTLAALHLKMNHYYRHKIDGKRFCTSDIIEMAHKTRNQTTEQRSKYPIIGHERMRLVAMGGALTEIILKYWDMPFIDIADRGQREGILREMLAI